MARIISLRTNKRQRARAEKARIGTENAAKFGRNHAEKELSQKLNAQAGQRLDGHLRQPAADAGAAPGDTGPAAEDAPPGTGTPDPETRDTGTPGIGTPPRDDADPAAGA